MASVLRTEVSGSLIALARSRHGGADDHFKISKILINQHLQRQANRSRLGCLQAAALCCGRGGERYGPRGQETTRIGSCYAADPERHCLSDQQYLIIDAMFCCVYYIYFILLTSEFLSKKKRCKLIIKFI